MVEVEVEPTAKKVWFSRTSSTFNVCSGLFKVVASKRWVTGKDPL